MKDAVAAQLVELRFGAGLMNEEAARALNISARIDERVWAFARALLFQELKSGAELERCRRVNAFIPSEAWRFRAEWRANKCGSIPPRFHHYSRVPKWAGEFDR